MTRARFSCAVLGLIAASFGTVFALGGDYQSAAAGYAVATIFEVCVWVGP